MSRRGTDLAVLIESLEVIAGQLRGDREAALAKLHDWPAGLDVREVQPEAVAEAESHVAEAWHLLYYYDGPVDSALACIRQAWRVLQSQKITA